MHAVFWSLVGDVECSNSVCVFGGELGRADKLYRLSLP